MRGLRNVVLSVGIISSVTASAQITIDANGKMTDYRKPVASQQRTESRPPAVADEWVVTNHKESQLIMTQTDEEGTFSVRVSPGIYEVYVRGRAGFNEALWDTEVGFDTRVQPGARVVLKLAKPRVSCLDLPQWLGLDPDLVSAA